MSFERSQSRTMSPSILELGPGPFSNCARVSHVAQSVKNLPAMQETWVRFLGWEDPLEKETAIHSSILAWKIPWIEKPGGLQSMGLSRVDHS